MGMANKRVTHIGSDYAQEKIEKQERKAKRRKGLARRLVAYFVVMALVLGGMSSVLFAQWQQLSEKKVDVEQMEQKLVKTKKKKKQLEKKIKQLHDLEYIGKIARRDYFLSDENEVIFSSDTSDKH